MKKVFALMITLALVMMCSTACGKNKMPDLEGVAGYSDEQLIELAKTHDEAALIKAWGEPQPIGNERLWKAGLSGETKYVTAYVENGNVISVNVSKIMYITVVKEQDGVKYCLFGWNDYTSAATNLAVMPAQDRFGNAITCEVGDQFLFETDGMVAETYPAQLSDPYEATLAGHLSDDVITSLSAGIQIP